jgi:hypothetical protein
LEKRRSKKNSDCFLEVSIHLESSATDQMYQGFPWVSSVSANAVLVPKFNAALHACNAAHTVLISEFHPKVVAPMFA